MTFLKKLICAFFGTPARFMPYGLLAVASYAHADWTIVQADATVTVIHGAAMYQAEAGQRISLDDIVETPPGGGVQIQDGTGNTVALGHDTRVLLARDARIALLQGWVKVQHACGAVKCAAPVIESVRIWVVPGEASALVMASSPPGYEDADAVFCESGTADVLGFASTPGKPLPIQLGANQFATRPPASETVSKLPRPDTAFVAAMPSNFRDALIPLPLPKRLHDEPSGNLRPVTYDDVSDWLVSALAVRTQPPTRFVDRFRARLSDPVFRLAIKQHVRALPDWRALVYPPPRTTAFQARPLYPYTSYRP